MNKKRALIIGGNRFFGRHLAIELLESGYEVTLLNRGRHDDGFGQKVRRINADRKQRAELEAGLNNQTWDVVFDQICFTAGEATSICELLEGRTERILFTSSQSVYG